LFGNGGLHSLFAKQAALFHPKKLPVQPARHSQTACRLTGQLK